MKCPRCSADGAVGLHEKPWCVTIVCDVCKTRTYVPLLDAVFLALFEKGEPGEISFQKVVEYCRKELASDYVHLADSLERLISETKELGGYYE